MRSKITFNDFISAFKDSTIITNSDIKKVFPRMSSDSTHLWNKKKYLLRVGKGIYFNNYFFKDKLNEQLLFLIANKAYSPSYVSLESALNYYGLIPEVVANITSITTKKTNTINYDLGEFIYKSIKPSLMFDFDIVIKDDFSFKIATPEKTIVDFLYLNPSLKSTDDFTELRINSADFAAIVNKERLLEITNKFKISTLLQRVLKFLEYIKNDQP